MDVSEMLLICQPNGLFVYDTQKLTPSSKSEKLDLLCRLILYKKPSSGVLGLKCIVSNQFFQQIYPKHLKSDWTLNMQRSACCLQLVNVLPLISTASTFFFLSWLSLVSLHLLSPCLFLRGKSLKLRFLGFVS